jgi:hypothetical protein
MILMTISACTSDPCNGDTYLDALIIYSRAPATVAMVLAALGMGDPGGEAGLYASCLQAVADRNLTALDVSIRWDWDKQLWGMGRDRVPWCHMRHQHDPTL